jgi:triose/dihydroxyacetone kinase / FAD-AMP lyase (cyclizing)
MRREKMAKPKNILNDPEHAVSEFISGLLRQYPHHLVQLEHHNVLLSASLVDTVPPTSTSSTTDTSRQLVHILSGGGSGHEPSHAGWIGWGMLSGAVCGGIFASPSVHSILAAIRAVSVGTLKNETTNDTGGVLLIVKNYTGDRLNFGLAAERAQSEGMATAMVIVADDCALPRQSLTSGARGVAGTVLVHKVAGAAAAQGQSLHQVAAWARTTAARLGTLGVALDSVTVPGATTLNQRLDDATIEIGLGIHGEAGRRTSPLLTATAMAREMIATIREYGRAVEDDSGATQIVPLWEAGEEVAILVNNLGGTSNFELSILTNSIVELLESAEFGQVRARRVWVGSYMTSFDMRGVSLTIVNVSGDEGRQVLHYLDAPTTAPAWSPCNVWQETAAVRPSMVPFPEVLVAATDADSKPGQGPAALGPPLLLHGFASMALARIQSAATKLADSEPLLTKYDTIVGDGDCGITMKRGATDVLRLVQENKIPLDHPVPMFLALAEAVSASMGGTSGVLLELMLRKMSSTLGRSNSIGTQEMCMAFQAGVEAVSHYGGAQVGSRTMLDALVPAASILVETMDLTQAASHARAGADSTALMKVASAGRSNYLSQETLEGTPDPGAVAVAIVLEALLLIE